MEAKVKENAVVFWLIAGGVSILLALLIWRVVLLARDTSTRPTAAYDLDLYRDQLRELDRDRARGLIADEEAERARVEISRRILEADKALAASGPSAAGPTFWMGTALVFMVAVAFVTYLGTANILRGFGMSETQIAQLRDAGLRLPGGITLKPVFEGVGAPGYPDVPLATRIAEIEANRAARPTQAMAEAQAPAFPPVELSEEEAAALAALRTEIGPESDDIDGLLALARAEGRVRNYAAARAAQERAAALMGPRAEAGTWVNLARMQILAAGGYVSPEGEASLRRALAIDPNQGDARFLLGAMYQRQNRPDLAFAIWRDLLAESPPDAPWVAPILDQIEEVAFFAGARFDLASIAPQGAPAPSPGAGPTQEQMDAAAQMSPEDRLAMIENMVAGLNDRLATEGGPPEDWARLIGAYGVLGNTELARAILAEAREVFAGEAAAQALFDQAEAALPQE